MMITAMKALLARTTEVGSRTIVWAATNDSKKGAYSNACRFEEESDYSLSAQGREGQKKYVVILEDPRVLFAYVPLSPLSEAGQTSRKSGSNKRRKFSRFLLENNDRFIIDQFIVMRTSMIILLICRLFSLADQ